MISRTFTESSFDQGEYTKYDIKEYIPKLPGDTAGLGWFSTSYNGKIYMCGGVIHVYSFFNNIYEFDFITSKFLYSIIDISDLTIDEVIPEATTIKCRYIKISIPQNNLYSRNKTTGVLTPENITELFIRGLDIIDTDKIAYNVLNTGGATLNGVVMSGLDTRDALMSLLKDIRSDIKIYRDLIIDLGSEKNVSNVNLVLGKYDSIKKNTRVLTL